MVAEISTSHLGSCDRAFKMLNEAKKAGADAVKFQTYTAEELAADVMIKSGPWAGRTYHDIYREGETPWDWHAGLFEYARSIGLMPFSSPFSEKAVVLLESIGCPIYKIASPEIVHLPLIAAAARTGKPLFISIGAASYDDIIAAVQTAHDNNSGDITLLCCLSAYPASVSDFNFRKMELLQRKGYRVGLSDHSNGSLAAIIATALGAEVIEKHFTLLRADGGLDAAFSAEPSEFEYMVNVCCEVSAAMGDESFELRDCEKPGFHHRRSIWCARDVKEGETIKLDNVAILRPNYGIQPCFLDDVIGKTATCDIIAGTPMNWMLFK